MILINSIINNLLINNFFYYNSRAQFKNTDCLFYLYIIN